jgi:5-methyltetrahydrofolate--homocysteine methyltransferase
MGTLLRGKGLPASHPPERWNLTRPEVVKEVHAAYLQVGCDLIVTNTFGGNRPRLKVFGLIEQVAEINLAGVRLAREVCPPGHFVAGSIGPTGLYQGGKSVGSPAEVVSAYQEQIALLLQGGVDLLLIETMTHLEEAYLALEVAKGSAPLPVAVSLVFFRDGGRFATLDGASPQEAAQALPAAQVVGCNCVDVETTIAVLQEMRGGTAGPALIAKPNAGLPEEHNGKMVYPLVPESLARQFPPLIALGPRILGGCCGTTPAHLREVIRLLHRP